MGKNVSVLEYGPRLVGRAVGEETAEYFLQAHRARGLDIRLERPSRAAAWTAGEAGSRWPASSSQDGTCCRRRSCWSASASSRTPSWPSSSGLAVDNGIVVDRARAGLRRDHGGGRRRGEHAQPGARAPPEGERIRLESVNNAIEHAKVAAYSLTGRREEYAGIPWFWSNQADLKLQIAGLSLGYDQTVVRRDDARGKFSVLYYRGGQIIAADCVNAPLDFMAVKNALAKGQNIPADAAADPPSPSRRSS